MSVCPVLKSLPAMGVPVFLARAIEGGDVRGEVRRSVGVRDALLDRRVGVDHRGQDVGVALLEAALELLDRGVHVGGFAVDLRGAAPHHHQPAQAVFALELLDVGDHLVGEVALALALLDVLSVQLLHVDGIEHRRPGLDRLQEALQGLQVIAVQHPRLARGLVGIVGVDVPPAEDDVVEPRDRHQLVDARAAVVGALAEAHGAHLGQAPHRLRQTLADGLHAGHERRGHRPHPGEKDAQLPLRGSDLAPPARARAHGWTLLRTRHGAAKTWMLPQGCDRSRRRISPRCDAGGRRG